MKQVDNPSKESPLKLNGRFEARVGLENRLPPSLGGGKYLCPRGMRDRHVRHVLL
jgi:hypothetical protein